MNTITKRPFVLSGGGSRGFAHLGVLKAFIEKDIYPEVISATSAGSIAAAYICDGYSISGSFLQKVNLDCRCSGRTGEVVCFL
ncbi:hypothetical protein DVR12_05790 [Chitinophaga silvatica]|uniref:PNPLA domain-containing protein n=1 Tax=Chitinophaga silvatica TaxID=2282649 RepID=A0A3E1YDM8_9BACT|nr:patatin-like phospholipase family protein [Chitinophaga silvatica]RFS24710.1 hypothetical protein DVR12_05790 [Chitinophaga silvatica]